MNAPLREVATLTSKGQVTLPKVIRQGLNLESGSQVVFELIGDSVMMTRLEPIGHSDPDIQAMLKSVQLDIATGRRLGLLDEPQSILGALLAMSSRTRNINAKIEGDVAL